ncbi:MAG TPA: shikimate dehydrogenase [Porticoccaceae bacterium]|nr:shikimate dehydrogenase [Porticoccaceae bacterium]
MTDRYAVVGNPVAHSLSPDIHRAFAQQTGENIDYSRIIVPAGQFNEVARLFFNRGGRGLNITVPCKGDAYQFADKLTAFASRAQAVNTLALDTAGLLTGDNTDGRGLVADLVDNLGWPIADKRLLILGAGGAVRGVLQPLLEQGPRELVIANRTPTKAADLADQFTDLGAVTGGGYDDLLEQAPFDLIINATSASLAGDLPPVPKRIVDGNTRCYDMMYAAQPTVFMTWCREQQCREAIDGLGMLVEQAALAFALWRGKQPATTSVIESIRALLAGKPS